MQRVNEFVFYDLAVKVHGLTEMRTSDVKYSDIVWQLNSARAALNTIYTQRPLHFTAQSASELYGHINAIIPLDFDEMIGKIDPDTTDHVSWWAISQIVQSANEFETALKTECAVMDAYYVVKKGAFSTKDLIENAHYQIPIPSRSAVTQITRDDFDQAGRCLAFDVYTAAAFHLLRGTEAVVREYYELKVPGSKQAAPKMRNWGTYIRLLKTYGGKAHIISILDHLRDAYRNPVLHPEDLYDEQRVLALFGLCVSAIILLQTEIESLKHQSATIHFPVLTPLIEVASGQ